MIYMQAFFRKTVLPDSYYYLMLPVLCAFRSYATKTREKFLASFYITLFQQTYLYVVPKINERDERDYERYMRNILDGL
jgi:hypothetical protein